jgi:Na+-transporting NADH:ubiquinone oxidoreductase subunit NqrF
VTTAQIYKGSIAFIVLQLIMVAVVIAYPSVVVSGIDQGVKVDADKALQEMVMPGKAPLETPTMGTPAASEPGAAAPAVDPKSTTERDDPMKALQDAVRKDAEAGKKP